MRLHPLLLCLALPFTSLPADAAAYATTTVVWINEVLANPAGTDDSREYMELKGTAGASLQNLALLEISGSGTNIGRIFWTRSLSALNLGGNGLALLGDNYATLWPYWLAPAQTAVADLLHPRGRFDNDTTSFLLVSNFTGAAGDDLDGDDDGVLDHEPWSQILDSVGWLDGSAGDRVYAAAVLSQSSGAPDAATRIPTNPQPNAAAAWYCGDTMTNAADPEGITYDPFRASALLPARAALTPGDTNYWSTARQPPLLAPLADQLLVVGNTLVLSVTALSTDGDAVALALGSGPALAQFGSTNEVGTFTWTPTATGQFTAVFTATDGDGVASATTRITVVTQPLATLRITEVMSKSLHPADLDWFEIYNFGSVTVNLMGFSWDDNSRVAGSAGFNGKLLPPGDTYIVTAYAPGSEANYRAEWGLAATVSVWCAGPTVFQNFSSNGDELHIYNGSGVELDSVVIPAATPGFSVGWAGDGTALGKSVAGVYGAYVAPSNGAGAAGQDVASPGRALRADPASDSDHDGYSDAEESVAGTDPESSDSYFRWQATAEAGSFMVSSGRWYAVEFRTNALAAEPWQQRTNFYAASNRVWQYVPGTQAQEIIRLRVWRP